MLCITITSKITFSQKKKINKVTFGGGGEKEISYFIQQ